jgi:hypothetical protein
MNATLVRRILVWLGVTACALLTEACNVPIIPII